MNALFLLIDVVIELLVSVISPFDNDEDDDEHDGVGNDDDDF